jgi:hypothetical protein
MNAPGTIHTEYRPKPGPLRMFDWEAWREGTGPDDTTSLIVGCGRTTQEAINDLKLQLEGVKR